MNLSDSQRFAIKEKYKAKKNNMIPVVWVIAWSQKNIFSVFAPFFGLKRVHKKETVFKKSRKKNSVFFE